MFSASNSRNGNKSHSQSVSLQNRMKISNNLKI
jgi:hypothetical protein